MTLTQDTNTSTTAELTVVQRYGEFSVVLVVLGMATFLTVGTITMDVPDGTGSPGPQFFPAIVAGLLYLLAVLLAIAIVRKPQAPHTEHTPGELSHGVLEDLGGLDSTSELRVLLSDEDAERVLQEQRDLQAGPTKAQEPSESTPPRTDWLTTAKVLIALIVFIFVLQPLGWILSAAALFWVIAWALGSKRPVFDVGVSLLFASSVQIAFVAGLGLSLPAGVFGGLL